MRRSEREITDPAAIAEIIAATQVCRVAMCDGVRPYVVPLNFGCKETDGVYTFYFHSAPQGRKIEILKNNPRVCIELDTNHALMVKGTTACSATYSYASVIANGDVRFITDLEEKRLALGTMLAQLGLSKDMPMEDDILRYVTVLGVTVQELSAKANPSEK